MALRLPAVLRGNRPGGSVALGELIDSGYGEEIYLDLKEFWDFDLVSFLAGEVFSSIPLILSLIRNLPEGSRFNAAIFYDRPPAPGEEFETDPRREAVADTATWTLERRLQAMAINAINMNTAVLGNWKDKAPDFPTIGPAAWQDDPAKSEPEYADNFDFFRKMGFPGG